MLAFGGALVVTVVMLAAISVLRDPPSEFDPDSFPVSTRVVYAMAVLAVPLNLLLIALLATQSTTLFLAWAGLVALGVLFYHVRTDGIGSTAEAVE
jgi:APA family basic amino acid/polyamine antiporter